MYGYLKYKNGNKVDKVSRMYKCYYCSLCHALKKNYGLFATSLLSYDLVFAAISLSSKEIFTDNKPLCCLYKRKKKIDADYSSDYWRGLSTSCVALAYSKLLDNYLDKPSALSKFLFYFTKFLSRKAIKNNPSVFSFLDKAMRELKAAEDNNQGFEVQSALSGKMISSALCDYNDVKFDDSNKKFLDAISKWLCFVDAIDDYEKDRKKKSYNPLFALWNNTEDFYKYSLKELIACKYTEIAEFYFKIVEQMNCALKEMNLNENERIFLDEMIHRVMPQKVGHIFSK